MERARYHLALDDDEGWHLKSSSLDKLSKRTAYVPQAMNSSFPYQMFGSEDDRLLRPARLRRSRHDQKGHKTRYHSSAALDDIGDMPKQRWVNELHGGIDSKHHRKAHTGSHSTEKIRSSPVVIYDDGQYSAPREDVVLRERSVRVQIQAQDRDHQVPDEADQRLSRPSRSYQSSRTDRPPASSDASDLSTKLASIHAGLEFSSSYQRRCKGNAAQTFAE